MVTLSVRALSIEFPTRDGVVSAVQHVSTEVLRGQVLAVVGESGAGKSALASAILRVLAAPGRIAGGEVWFEGRRIDLLPEREFARFRGRRIGAVFQDANGSLDPLRTIGDQLMETIRRHVRLHPAARRRLAEDLLAEVGIVEPGRRLRSYPHQLSGGERQRVVVALSLAPGPSLLIADEPTSAVDALTQANIVALLEASVRSRGMSMILITHDLGAVADIADRIAIMYGGRIVETGPALEVLRDPLHPYTRSLIAAVPSLDWRDPRLAPTPGQPSLVAKGEVCGYHPRCNHATDLCRRGRPPLLATTNREVACFLRGEPPGGPALPAPALPAIVSQHGETSSDSEPLVEVDEVVHRIDRTSIWRDRLSKRRDGWPAVDGVSFRIGRGKTLALVGESGSGKTTLARILVGLIRPTSGQVRFDGLDVHSGSFRRGDARRRLSMVFQNVSGSLDPHMKVGEAVAEPIKAFRLAQDADTRRRAVDELLVRVGLTPAHARRYPHQLSGGERQRVALARAISSDPDFLVCDEPTSSLDVYTQALILNLLGELQKERKLTCLLITHNLSIVRLFAADVAVIYRGVIVELAETDSVFESAKHPYTKALVASMSRWTDRTSRDRRALASPDLSERANGCVYSASCAMVEDRCRATRPVLRRVGASDVACHLA